MRTELFIARRYFFSGKRRNIINIITSISVIGIGVGAMALVIVLSVFNGFDGLVKILFGSFDSDLKVEIVVGKTFHGYDSTYLKISRIDGISYVGRVYEDNALIKYDDRTHPVRLKGVESDWWDTFGVDSMIIDGAVYTRYDTTNFCIVGQGLAYAVNLGLYFTQPMWFYAPRKTESKEVRAENAFVSGYLFPTGIFAIQNDIDSKYTIVPLSFVHNLFQADSLVTAFEIKVKEGYSVRSVQKKLQNSLGTNFTVKDRIQQHEFLYKVMQAEKWIIFAILTFILIIASFSIIGSLMMLIIEKKEDAKTLRTMGAGLKTIRRLFLVEGLYITLVGSLWGMGAGALVCFIQEKFGIIKINSSGNLLIDAYPVEMIGTDFILIFLTVGLIGYLASYYSTHFITRKYFGDKQE